MLEISYLEIGNDNRYESYICSDCGQYLGVFEENDGTITRDDIDGWKFCPYCGHKLYDYAYHNIIIKK